MGIRAAIGLVLTLLYFNLHAQLKGELRDSNFSDYNIAVQDVYYRGDTLKLAKKITRWIKNDLRLSGYFNVLDNRSFLEKNSVPMDKVDFKNWMNVGANGLIKGFLKKKGKTFEFSVAFFDVASGKKYIHKIFKGNREGMRKSAHKFVNAVVNFLTGDNISFPFSKIVFVEKGYDGKKKVYRLVLINPDGTGRKILISGTKEIMLPAWSKDGKRIFYTSYSNGSNVLYAMDYPSGKRWMVSSYPGLNVGASSSPDGKSIVLTLSKDGNSEIYQEFIFTKKLRRLTKNIAIDTAPSFSYDGKQVAFVSNRSGEPHIYRLFLDDPSRVERLTMQGNYNQDPAYSPDGRYIAFTGRDEFYKFDIFLYDLKNRVIKRVTQKQGKNENPDFSPDSKVIVFSSDRNGKEAIFLSNIEGDEQIMIYSSKFRCIEPSWSPEFK